MAGLATNIAFHHAPSNRGLAGRGWAWARGTATLPIGTSVCQIAEIPNLTDLSVVKISQHGNYGNTAALINIKASNTNGMVGTIVIGTMDTSVVTSDCNFSFEVENP
jgi:hypothetical protein